MIVALRVLCECMVLERLRPPDMAVQPSTSSIHAGTCNHAVFCFAFCPGALWAVLRLFQRVRAAGGLREVGAAIYHGEGLWDNLEGVWEYLVEGAYLHTRLRCEEC